MQLSAHPRLYIRPHAIARQSTTPPEPPLLARAHDWVADAAELYLTDTEIIYDRRGHNAMLIRARHTQGRIVTLLCRWLQTHEERFREGVLGYVRQMAAWEYWSWIAWRDDDPAPDAIFDLSYGENCATLAIVWDLLHETMDEAERRLILDQAEQRAILAFRKHTEPENRAWWFGSPHSNWNTVCAGGGGMLVLALHEHIPDADELLSRVEESIAPFYESLAESGGGWPEGIGYWNYGMRYGFMYLLSHEAATGESHRFLESPHTRATLRFPLDLCPWGVPSSFGDVNHWKPLPFHYAVAGRCGMPGLVHRLENQESEEPRYSAWPDAAELLLLHPGLDGAAEDHVESPALRRYQGLDWMVLADQLPEPTIYMSLRGGSTEVPHGHLDLLSYHCSVGDEAMITNLGPSGYLDTTFSPRRWDLFEMRPDAKNTLLVNGVGIAPGSEVTTTALTLDGAAGYLLDASDPLAVNYRGKGDRGFAGRLALLLDEGAILLVDRISLVAYGRMESRLFTHTEIDRGDSGALLRGERRNLRVQFAADVEGVVTVSTAALTAPRSDPRMLRWRSVGLEPAMTLATLLTPGSATSRISVESDENALAITVGQGDWQRQFHFDIRLTPAH